MFFNSTYIFRIFGLRPLKCYLLLMFFLPVLILMGGLTYICLFSWPVTLILPLAATLSCCGLLCFTDILRLLVFDSTVPVVDWESDVICTTVSGLFIQETVVRGDNVKYTFSKSSRWCDHHFCDKINLRSQVCAYLICHST